MRRCAGAHLIQGKPVRGASPGGQAHSQRLNRWATSSPPYVNEGPSTRLLTRSGRLRAHAPSRAGFSAFSASIYNENSRSRPINRSTRRARVWHWPATQIGGLVLLRLRVASAPSRLRKAGPAMPAWNLACRRTGCRTERPKTVLCLRSFRISSPPWVRRRG